MLSVANVRTAGGAANYFAADNYYTRADADRSGEWLGKGAAALGLSGTVDARQFEAVLKGLLPDGSRRPHHCPVAALGEVGCQALAGNPHGARAGIDLRELPLIDQAAHA